MNIKKVLLSCLMLAGVLSVSAQEAKTEYVHNPYWYIQVQGGAQYTLGEIDFKDLISPNVQVSLGRQFTPIFGARLSVNAWQSRAGIELNSFTYPNVSGEGAQGTTTATRQGGTFIGGGANIAWGMDKASNWDNDITAQYFVNTYAETGQQNIDYYWTGTKVRAYGRAGITVDFRVSEAVSLGLEVNANTLSDHYNGKKANNWDWYFNALAGIKINLGKTHTTRTIEAPKPVERVVEKVVEKIIEKPCPPVEPTNAVVVKEPFRRDVFFSINKTAVTKQEQVKVKEVADYLKANPNATVEVTGYADRGTGNPRINKRLSDQRAKSVFNMLTKQYKIAASRIKVDFKGDTIQPFAKEVENRVTICIAE